jgi:hypothetical protein
MMTIDGLGISPSLSDIASLPAIPSVFYYHTNVQRRCQTDARIDRTVALLGSWHYSWMLCSCPLDDLRINNPIDVVGALHRCCTGVYPILMMKNLSDVAMFATSSSCSFVRALSLGGGNVLPRNNLAKLVPSFQAYKTPSIRCYEDSNSE